MRRWLKANSSDETSSLLSDGNRDEANGSVLNIDSTSETPQQRRHRICSIYIIYYCALMKPLIFTLSDISRLQYMETISRTATATTLTWMFAALTVSQLVCTPVFGFWLDKLKKARTPLLFASILDLVAVLLYCYASVFPPPREYVLIASSILVGVCDGSVPVLLAYLVGASTLQERSSVMIRLQITRHIGGLLAPIFQYFFSFLGYPGPVDSPALQFNMYTAPFLMIAVFQVAGLFLLICVFKEVRISDIEKSRDIKKDERFETVNAPIDYVAAGVCIYGRCVRTINLSMIEAMTALLLRDMYSLNHEQTTKIASYSILGFLLLLALFLLIILKSLTKVLTDRQIMLIASIAGCISVFLLLPWGDTLPQGPHPSATTNTTKFPYEPHREIIGCRYEWCKHVPVIPVPQLISAAVVCAVCVTGFDSSAAALYSKVLGSQPQGISMSVYSLISAVGRLAGTMGVMNLYIAFGLRVAFSFQLCLCVILLLSVALAYKRLVPRQVYAQRRNEGYTRLES